MVRPPTGADSNFGLQGGGQRPIDASVAIPLGGGRKRVLIVLGRDVIRAVNRQARVADYTSKPSGQRIKRVSQRVVVEVSHGHGSHFAKADKLLHKGMIKGLHSSQNAHTTFDAGVVGGNSLFMKEIPVFEKTEYCELRNWKDGIS